MRTLMPAVHHYARWQRLHHLTWIQRAISPRGIEDISKDVSKSAPAQHIATQEECAAQVFGSECTTLLLLLEQKVDLLEQSWSSVEGDEFFEQ
jgi:hypothetical protein